MPAEELNRHLSKFYAEATPKFVEKREKEMSAAQAQEYHKNSFKSIRGGINRYIKDIDRDIDIVRDKQFRRANEILDGKLKQNLHQGLSRPTLHKDIISVSDLDKINTYLYSDNNPVILRFRVWYNIAIHFVSRGLEFHQQLNLNSFVFHKDENDREFVVLSHETKQKNWQGGLDSGEAASDKRMYAIADSDKCPVKNLKLLLAKTDPTATSLFNHCSKDALVTPNEERIWYTTKSVKQYQFSRFMSDISKQSKCSKSYTAHCLRATAIQGMSDAGFELRHIMFMSGHKNESSVRSYNRSCSTNQKEALSDTLSLQSQLLKNQQQCQWHWQCQTYPFRLRVQPHRMKSPCVITTCPWHYLLTISCLLGSFRTLPLTTVFFKLIQVKTDNHMYQAD